MHIAITKCELNTTTPNNKRKTEKNEERGIKCTAT